MRFICLVALTILVISSNVFAAETCNWSEVIRDQANLTAKKSGAKEVAITMPSLDIAEGQGIGSWLFFSAEGLPYIGTIRIDVTTCASSSSVALAMPRTVR